MSSTVQANDGAMIPLDSIPQTFAYSGSFISTITVVYQTNTYVQTFTNNGTNITNISGWVNPLYPYPATAMTDELGNVMTDESGAVMIME